MNIEMIEPESPATEPGEALTQGQRDYAAHDAWWTAINGDAHFDLTTRNQSAAAYAQGREDQRAAAIDAREQEDYRDGVNVDALAHALTLMGIAGCGREEMAARMSQYVNYLTRGVESYFEKWNASREEAPAASEPGLPLAHEPKYTVNGTHIVNRASGEAIPHDEPVFILRARDSISSHALMHYATHIRAREPSSAHADAVASRIADFANFARTHPARMKWPDTAPAVTMIRLPVREMPEERSLADQPDAEIAALEREHMGDPDERTGIYAPSAEALRIFALAMVAANDELLIDIAGDTRDSTDSPLVVTAKKSRAALFDALEVPEGCTPTDARVLRQANHDLAQEVHDLREQLAKLTAPQTAAQAEAARVLEASAMLQRAAT